jgi:glycosyltransferase involved in cell wall biosynthesis
MRVLHTIGEMGTGGAESLVVELVTHSRGLGWTSDVASAGGRREDELRAAGLGRFHRVPLSRRRPDGLARAVAASRSAVRAADPDVVLAHNVGATVASWLALRSLRRPTPLATVFHGVAASDYRAAAMTLSVAPQAVVTVSAAIRDRLAAAGLRRRTPIVIPNAVTAPTPVDPAVARAELALPTDAPVALCAARLVVQKRHDVLLHAWALTTAAERGAVLLLAGDGPERAAVEARVRTLGLEASVRILGARDDVPRLLAAADVCTLASDWEGLPMALLEAMAAGRPVVATAVDGVREILRHGGGRLAPPGDPAALAAALDALLTDPAAARTAGAEAARVAADHYDPAVMMHRYNRLLRSLLTPAAQADPEVRLP